MRPNEMVFYKANKVGDEKIEHCDHQITSDIDKFAETFASVLSQSLKPIGTPDRRRPALTTNTIAPCDHRPFVTSAQSAGGSDPPRPGPAGPR